MTVFLRLCGEDWRFWAEALLLDARRAPYGGVRSGRERGVPHGTHRHIAWGLGGGENDQKQLVSCFKEVFLEPSSIHFLDLRTATPSARDRCTGGVPNLPRCSCCTATTSPGPHRCPTGSTSVRVFERHRIRCSERLSLGQRLAGRGDGLLAPLPLLLEQGVLGSW